MRITLEDVKNNDEVKAFFEIAEQQIENMGYTEHSYRHVSVVAEAAGRILTDLGYPEREAELARIAGYLHDLGNSINRVDHAHSGAIIAYNILGKMGMDIREITPIMLAIGNHDENTGMAVSPISAALILADKSDVHRGRVKNKDFATFDIHDRVNYAVEKSKVYVEPEMKIVGLELDIDTKIVPVMEYFEIFLVRMTMNRKAAQFLGLTFQLIINGTRLL